MSEKTVRIEERIEERIQERIQAGQWSIRRVCSGVEREGRAEVGGWLFEKSKNQKIEIKKYNNYQMYQMELLTDKATASIKGIR